MSYAGAALGKAGATSLTVRQFRRALGVAATVLAFGCLLYGVEKYLLQCQRRFIENPTDVMMRAFGLAHFLIGWLFLFTSPRLRSRAGLGRLLLATLGGAGLWTVFVLAGGTKNPFILMTFYSLFLIHEVRDEKNLFQVYGDAPSARPLQSPPYPGGEALLNSLSVTACLLLVTVLAAAYLVNDKMLREHPRLAPYPAAYLWAGFGLLGIASACSLYGTLQMGLRVHGHLRSFVKAHAPLLGVYLAIMAILLAGSLLGSVGFNLIILVHVTVWLVFVHHQLGRKSAPARNLWTWLRYTPTGFLVLHVGLAAILLVLMALRVHVWGRVGLVSVLLASASFPYWSLMHIAMSFWRGRS